MRTLLLPLAAGSLLLAPAMAAAQAGDPPSLRARHLTLGGGVSVTGGYSIGDATARLRGNAVGGSAPPFTLFRADSTVDLAPAVEARVGYSLTEGLALEVGLAYSRPGITTVLSGDPEAAPITLDAETLAQYVIDVGAVWQMPRPVVGGRVRPFVTGGGGYLRQLYDARTLVETGRIYYLGGGARYWLRGGDGRRRSVGVRGDVRAVWRQDGVEFEGRTRVAPAFSLHLFAEL